MHILKDKSCKKYLYGKAILIEPTSKRIKIYQLPNQTMMKHFMFKLKALAKKNDCDKIIFYARHTEKEQLKAYTTCYEGMIKGFFNGEDAYIYAIFLYPKRNKKELLSEEIKVLEYIKKKKEIHHHFQLPKGYRMRWAVSDDAEEMAILYQTVFKSYPTPMNDPDFIIEMMNSDVYFLVVEKNNKIVSACSADLLPEFKSAELSDCATFAEHRQKQLLSYQVAHLIPLVKEMGIKTLFSYSRSVSIGMNLVNVKHGFEYGGRMVQNSNIAGSFENMNIWYKNL